MIPTLIGDVIAKLEADVTLTGMIGAEHVFRAKREAPEQIPSVTVKGGTDMSKNQCGAVVATQIRRDASSTIQIDIWVSSAGDRFPSEGEDADLIQTRVEAILLDPRTPVTGTRSWEKITESQQEDGGIWHNVVRFAFDYGLVEA